MPRRHQPARPPAELVERRAVAPLQPQAVRVAVRELDLHTHAEDHAALALGAREHGRTDEIRDRNLPGSKIREVTNAALGRDDVLAFWVGESDEVTPKPIREAAIASLQRGKTFYSANLGLPELCEETR